MALYEEMCSDTVAELNLRTPVTVTPGTTLRDTILKMRDASLGCAIVVDDQRRPVGMFTEAMLRRLVSESPLQPDRPIEEFTATFFPTIKLSETVETVLDALELKNARFLVVVDDDGCVAGLTGQKGLMECIAEQFPQEVLVQRVGTEPYPHSREGA